MSTPADLDRSARPHPARAAAAVLTSFLLIAVFDAVVIAATVPLPRAGLALRAAHHLFDAAETLGVGLIAAALVGLFVRFVRIPAWAAALVYAAAAAPIAWLAIGDGLQRLSSYTLEGRFQAPLLVAYLAASACLVPAAHVTGAFAASRPRLRLVAVVVGLGVLSAQHFILSDDYFGFHGMLVWTSATLVGAALAPLTERALRHTARGVALAAVAIAALLGVAVPPPNAARFELFRQPSALAPWVLATALWRPPPLHDPTRAPPSSPRPADGAEPPALAPTSPPLLPPNPVVVLLTVDALRADAVFDPANARRLPNLSAMQRRGVVFTHASAPASQTALSLTTTFSGRYFSELFWTGHGRGSGRFNFPSDDPSPRFPQLLSERGVATATWASVSFLAADYGIVRGFRDEKVLVRGRRHARAREIMKPLLARLEAARDEPLFLYAHLMEPHVPYDRGGRKGTLKERYLREVALVDAEIGRVVRLLEKSFGDRWVLLVSADHGEAFGEHRTFEHSKTLYEELLHVPLLVQSPRIAPRIVEQRVGLVDVGPTILDLFGVATPATYAGRSLVPLLAGQSITIPRPLLAEGRLRRALTTPTGIKVIEDPRRKVVEVYDLANDPGETRNLFDLDPARSDAALGALRAFFEEHRLKRSGYQPPYEP